MRDLVTISCGLALSIGCDEAMEADERSTSGLSFLTDVDGHATVPDDPRVAALILHLPTSASDGQAQAPQTCTI